MSLPISGPISYSEIIDELLIPVPISGVGIKNMSIYAGLPTQPYRIDNFHGYIFDAASMWLNPVPITYEYWPIWRPDISSNEYDGHYQISLEGIYDNIHEPNRIGYYYTHSKVFEVDYDSGSNPINVDIDLSINLYCGFYDPAHPERVSLEVFVGYPGYWTGYYPEDYVQPHWTRLCDVSCWSDFGASTNTLQYNGTIPTALEFNNQIALMIVGYTVAGDIDAKADIEVWSATNDLPPYQIHVIDSSKYLNFSHLKPPVVLPAPLLSFKTYPNLYGGNPGIEPSIGEVSGILGAEGLSGWYVWTKYRFLEFDSSTSVNIDISLGYDLHNDNASNDRLLKLDIGYPMYRHTYGPNPPSAWIDASWTSIVDTSSLIDGSYRYKINDMTDHSIGIRMIVASKSGDTPSDCSIAYYMTDASNSLSPYDVSINQLANYVESDNGSIMSKIWFDNPDPSFSPDITAQYCAQNPWGYDTSVYVWTKTFKIGYLPVLDGSGGISYTLDIRLDMEKNASENVFYIYQGIMDGSTELWDTSEIWSSWYESESVHTDLYNQGSSLSVGYPPFWPEPRADLHWHLKLVLCSYSTNDTKTPPIAADCSIAVKIASDATWYGTPENPTTVNIIDSSNYKYLLGT